MNLLLIFFVCFSHWIGDFVLQDTTKKSRKKIKYKNLKHIIPHTLLYTSILTILVNVLQIFYVINSIYYLSFLYFFLITYLTHFFTDLYVTKYGQILLKRNHRHHYVMLIGFDYFVHIVTLFATINFLYRC